MRLRAALFAVVLLPIVGAGAAGAAPHKAPKATLIDVHVFKGAAKPGGGGSANCSNAGAETDAFATTGWVVAGATTASLNASTVPAGLTGAPAALQTSFNAWPGAPHISVTTGTPTTKPTANHSYELMWGRTSGSSLAITYTWRWSNGEVESDTIFNKGVPWFIADAEGDGCIETTAKYDVANIATHEFGHTYGLDHPSGARFATMYAYGYTGETLKRSPAQGDVIGIRSLY
jgi:hypothetical protein